ncbi:MAG: hypothetical protein J0L92_23550 [Deltaproteobacteria bacterium]|nr:hypothetical protein [Deltaproteobacteria bacterium]
MIDYDGRNWLDIVTRVRGSVLPRLLPRALFGGALGGVAAWAWDHHQLRVAPIAHTMIGVALGLLLVFRTNAELTRTIDALRKQGVITETQQLVMDQNLGVMTDALTGCERILRTPVPFAYAQHIKLFVILFCYTAPFTMSDAMGWYTPLAATLLCIALFGVDEIGVEIEDPFGRDPNDLPLDAMADLLEKTTIAVVSA